MPMPRNIGLIVANAHLSILGTAIIYQCRIESRFSGQLLDFMTLISREDATPELYFAHNRPRGFFLCFRRLPGAHFRRHFPAPLPLGKKKAHFSGAA